MLAARLSEEPARRVLLLEAGPFHPFDALPPELRVLGHPVAWPYEWGEQVESIDGRHLPYLRGRGVGGSSATNGAVAMRAEPADFEGWPEGWGWDDLLPSFRRSERDLDFGDQPFHGNAGPVPITRWPRQDWIPLQRRFHEACVEVGFADCPDHNAPGTTGVGPIPMNRVGNERVSAALAYLAPASERANLEIRGDAGVSRIVFDGRRATGVELESGETIAAGEVILAAGVLQSPQLLQRSGIGAPEDLAQLGVDPRIALPAVGHHWSDHFVVNFATPIDRHWVPRGAPGLQTLLRATAAGSHTLHDLQVTPWARRAADGDGLECVLSVSLQQPRGTAALRSDGQATRLHWPFPGEADNLRRVGEGLRLAARILAAAGVSRTPDALAAWQERSEADLAQHVRREHQAFYHGVGTCRMGEESATDTVVDPEGRVRGSQGLRICDASIAPRVPRSNTNLLVMAMAEHLAARIGGS